MQQRRRAVDAGFTGHIVNERDVVYDRAERRNRFAEELSAFAVRLKIPKWFEPRAKSVLKGFYFLAEIAGLSVPFGEFRFVIEKIKMAGRARHKKMDDTFGFRGMMKFGILGKRIFFTKHCGEREAAQASAGLP